MFELHYCVGSNTCEKPALCAPLTFPISRAVLWDHRDIGPPAVVNITQSRLVHLDVCVLLENK